MPPRRSLSDAVILSVLKIWVLFFLYVEIIRVTGISDFDAHTLLIPTTCTIQFWRRHSALSQTSTQHTTLCFPLNTADSVFKVGYLCFWGYKYTVFKLGSIRKLLHPQSELTRRSCEWRLSREEYGIVLVTGGNKWNDACHSIFWSNKKSR